MIKNTRYPPHSERFQQFPQSYHHEALIKRASIHNSLEDGITPAWIDPNNYQHKIATIIEHETSADVHLPGAREYKRRKVQNGTCANIFPDMIVVPRSDEDISKIVEISTIVGVPISVTSEGRSYNLCKHVNSGKTIVN